MKSGKWTLGVALLSGMLCLPVMAQDAGRDGNNPPAQDGGNNRGGDRGGQNGGGGRQGRMNFEDFRKQQAERLKTALGMTDEEFTAISPKLDQIRKTERDANNRLYNFGGGRGGRGGGGGFGGAGGDQTPSDVQTKGKALQDAIEQKASDGEVLAKLEDYRSAKTKAKEELKKLQDDLRQFISKRQEAVLVANGVME